MSEALDKEIAEKLMENEVQPYSTDLVSASRVLNHLHKNGFFWRLDSVHDGVICTLQNVKRVTYSVRSGTIAQAICEAALRTVSGQKEKEQ